jgi:Flp pilus assembly protein CpaB
MLVAAAAVLVFTAALAASRNHDGSYVVADRALPAGTMIGPQDTATVRLGLSGATESSAFRQSSLVVGRTLAVAVGPGQLIMSSMLTTSGGSGVRPVSIPVDPDSLAALSTGVSVDVLAVAGGAGASAPAPSSTMSVVLRGATLLSVSKPSSGFLSNSGASVVVTLGVGNLAEAEQLVAAAHSGTIELVQAQPGDGRGPGQGP